MPTVSVSVELVDVSIESVWEIVSDFERYPELMADVLSVRVLRREAGRCTTSWTVLLNGSELSWVEEDRFRPPESIDFAQSSGDLADLRGSWLLAPTTDGVRVTLNTIFDIGIPSLADVLDPIGEQAIRANARQMLQAIQLASGAHEEVSGP